MLHKITKNNVIVSLYVLVAVCLLMAVWNPAIYWKDLPLEVSILLDNSNSMRNSTREDFLNPISSILDQTPYSQKVFGFAGKTYHFDTFQTKGEYTGSTNIAQALAVASKNFSPQVQNAVLIVSDFGETSGDSLKELRRLKNKGVSVYIHQVKNQRPDIWLDIINKTNVASVGEKVMIPVRISSTVDNEFVLDLIIDGQTVKTVERTVLANESIDYVFSYIVNRPGKHQFDINIKASADTVAANNQVKMLLNVDDVSTILYVTESPEAYLFSTLGHLGVQVKTITPAKLSNNIDIMQSYSSLVLDNVHKDDLTLSNWQKLVNAVKQRGLNLLVLGGDRSFSMGGYRRSHLEEILPVISEPRKEEETSAFLFLIDKSGSMGLEPSGHNRSFLAQQAVLNTSRIMQAGDYLGVIAFDNEATEFLSLNQYQDPSQAILDNWSWTPNGGTMLTPALDMAIQKLRVVNTQQKILVVLTDGFVEKNISSKHFTRLKDQLQKYNIALQIIGIGSQIEKNTLKKLISDIGGRLNTTSDILALPALMRSQVEKLRTPTRQGLIFPIIRTSLPFFEEGKSLPGINKYVVTRAKENAVVVLEADNGDPLFAYQFSGTGLVAALPSDTNNWMKNWHEWKGRDRFSQNLINWISGIQNRNSYIQSVQTNTHIQLTIDELDEHLNWRTDQAPIVDVVGPGGELNRIHTSWIAPGRATLKVLLDQAGVYTVNIKSNASHRQLDYMHDGNIEYISVGSADRTVSRWLQQKLVIPWKNNSLDLLEVKSKTSESRLLFLALAVLLYLILMSIERGFFIYNKFTLKRNRVQ